MSQTKNFNGKDYIDLQNLLENSVVAAVFVLDLEGHILLINKGVTDWLGYTEESVKGKYFSFLYIKEDQEGGLPENELKTVISRGNCRDNNFICHMNGTAIWSNGESVLTETAVGGKLIIKTVYNLQKEKMLQDDLQKNVNELKNFVYVASHDLKAPLSNLSGLVSILENSGLPEDQGDVVKMIRQSVTLFGNILSDLADQGRLQHTADTEERQEVLLSEIFAEVKLMLQKQITVSQAEIRENFSKVPSVNLLKKHVRSLLFNLTSNAIKYRRKDQTPFVEVSSESADGFVLLKIQDNGVGISQENKLKVFDLYNRFKHEGVKGTGVGLAVVRNIVDGHGGHIEIESEEGTGTLFKIYLPK